MKHDCLTYWGNHLTALAAHLDAGARARPGAGWAVRLARKHEYDALLLLRTKLNIVGPSRLKRPPKWKKGQVRVPGLLAATCNLLGGLEADRLSTSSGSHTPGAQGWHASGTPDPDSIDEMANVLQPRLKHALGV